ncbi:MAG: quinone oxidoreductase family protein [Vulcanimicrobiaceae bacterium]
MKAILVERPGGPEALQLADVAVPQPKPGEALVKLAAIGVNFIDVYYRTGLYKAPKLPFTPGMEGAGTVEVVGDGVTVVTPGERVAWAMSIGSYGEYAIVPAEKLVHVPDGLAFRDAAALMLQGMTAHYLCNSTFALKAGDVALVHAGAGGVGLLLTQLAKAKGATIITTVSTEEKAALSRGAGADHVVNYTDQDFAAEARRLTGGRGVDVVYDSVGKTTFDKSLDSLRPRGYQVLFGASSGPVPPCDLQTLAAKGSLFVTRPSLANYAADRAELTWRSGEVLEAAAQGRLKLRLEHEYPLADAARAHTDLEARKTTGKLLLIP